jgi:hypothetical protein
MAVYNELQVGRYVRFLQKFLGMKGRQPAPLTFSGEVGAVIPLFHGAENRYFEGWIRYATFFNMAASVGNPSSVQIRNPANSNVVAVVERFMVSLSVADSVPPGGGFGYRCTADLLTVLTRPAALDRRFLGSSSLIPSRGNTALTNGINIWQQPTAANIAIDLILTDIQELPIAPNDGVGFQSANNVAVTAGILWRERPLEESEIA